MFHKSNANKHGLKCCQCSCFLSVNDLRDYTKCLNNATNYEKVQDWPNTLQWCLKALKICDSDVNLHVQCVTLGETLNEQS